MSIIDSVTIKFNRSVWCFNLTAVSSCWFFFTITYFSLNNYLILEYIHFEATARKNAKIILRNFAYETASITPKQTYWKCVSYYKTRCKARMITQGKVAKITFAHHNHPAPEKNVNSLPFTKVTVVEKINYQTMSQNNF